MVWLLLIKMSCEQPCVVLGRSHWLDINFLFTIPAYATLLKFQKYKKKAKYGQKRRSASGGRRVLGWLSRLAQKIERTGVVAKHNSIRSNGARVVWQFGESFIRERYENHWLYVECVCCCVCVVAGVCVCARLWYHLKKIW